MRLIPVIDLAQGRAVHARAGDRASYPPVESVLIPGRNGDALALVQAYRDAVGARECYLADLDAIQGGQLQRALLRRLTRDAAPCGVLVDAGVHSPDGVKDVLALGAAAVVIGLETLPSLEVLGAAVTAAGSGGIVFSLDLRLGRPLLSAAAAASGTGRLGPEELASRAVEAGVEAMLVLDLGRVGTGRGVDLELLRRLRRHFPSVRLLAGGGVAGPEDLTRLAEAGCDGALVATALHTGRMDQSSTSASRQVADCP
ncbi:MAG TPA: HisA/HisF-related TIM barrel protein [Gemmatimonadales bacterium]|jgi:phosphoribosylformimino-5-aminoimidazole carboxamide ribotide isomerase